MLDLKRAALVAMSDETIADLVRANISNKPFADVILNAVDEDEARVILADLLQDSDTSLKSILDGMFVTHSRRTIGAVVKESGLTEDEVTAQVEFLSGYKLFQGRNSVFIEPADESAIDESEEPLDEVAPTSESTDAVEDIEDVLENMFGTHRRRSLTAVANATGETLDTIRDFVNHSSEYELWVGRTKTYVQVS